MMEKIEAIGSGRRSPVERFCWSLLLVVALIVLVGCDSRTSSSRSASKTKTCKTDGTGAPAPEMEADFVSSIGLKMRLIKPGKFMMGSPSNEKGRAEDDCLQREGTIEKPFYLGIYPVTQQEYQQIMGKNPSRFGTGYNPVEQVTWNEAQEFCKKLTEIDIQAGKLPPGESYRLPTEAEWEYACRAGTRTRFYWGDDLDYSEIGDYAWYSTLDGGENSGKKPHPVGQKEPNGWGLYDMSGNVSQWCLDAAYQMRGEKDCLGTRGGSCRVAPCCCRSASRITMPPNMKFYALGFRIVRAAAQEEKNGCDANEITTLDLKP